MIRALKFLCSFILFSSLPASAQMSVGTSSQIQIGWSGYNKSVNRYTNINQRGTSGENITPSDNTDRFMIYGSEFKVNNKDLSFDYSSIANDNITVTDLQQNNFSVFGNYSGTSTRSTRPPRDWFGR